MKSRGIFAVLAAQVAGLVANAARMMRRIGYDTPHRHKDPPRVHGRGKQGQRGLVGKPGAKLWHRLTTGHSTAGLSDRQTRRWCATGRWSKPRKNSRPRSDEYLARKAWVAGKTTTVKRKAEAMEATA